ncbi:SH3BP5 [Cordylochernes scorpioides]|uniref:SH3BP5 n=1 Tax=Cordylochernes scorpioides TaxID=51811 RepID=A0ABY6LKY0_9ARAC|nr:SH3BP5 [Cordylochernes scorpioides]
MVPSKLLRHIETNHREQMNNPISYFENIRSSFQKQSKKFKKFMTTSDEAQTASYMIAQLIARKKKAHAEAEEIILPALKIVAGCMLTNDAMEKVTKIPLSSKTIARRIEDMSEDIELQIKQSFNDSSTKWAIQLDETTDISNKAQLLAFLRFVDTGKIVNNYFFCKELKQRTTGADIFELVDENVMKYNLRWENCVSVCTDGAPAIKENFASFPMVQENPSKSIIKKEVEETLALLSASFDKYFPYLDVEKMEWVVNPFMHCEIQHLEEEMQENLIDLKNDLVFKRLFTEKELAEFWLCLNSKFPKLSNAAIESLLPFGSSYLCEQGFSTLTEMKSKKRERLQMIDEEMRVCLSQGQLESLNNCTTEINLLEKQLDEANALFRSTLNETSHRLRQQYKKLGRCIEIARPYYDSREATKQAQLECQQAAQQFQRAREAHREARHTLQVAETRLAEGWQFDRAWQEMVNRANAALVEAQETMSASEIEHKRRTAAFAAAQDKTQRLEMTLKKSIVKSRPYFEHKSIFQSTLQGLKQRVDSLQAAVSAAKASYSQSLQSLEAISEEIHARRKTREPGVGAESTGLERDDDLRSVLSEEPQMTAPELSHLFDTELDLGDAGSRRNSLPSLSNPLDFRLSFESTGQSTSSLQPPDSVHPSPDTDDGFVDIDLS